MGANSSLEAFLFLFAYSLIVSEEAGQNKRSERKDK
jgi:hypothetical protein